MIELGRRCAYVYLYVRTQSQTHEAQRLCVWAFHT